MSYGVRMGRGPKPHTNLGRGQHALRARVSPSKFYTALKDGAQLQQTTVLLFIVQVSIVP